MTLFAILLTAAFSIILCVVEVPKMRKKEEYKELAVFSVILCFGIVIAVLKSLDIAVPNPADFVDVIYSPVTSLMKGVLE